MGDIVTLEEAKEHLNHLTMDAAQEAELERFVAAAEVVVVKKCPAAAIEPDAPDVRWDKAVTRGLDTLILPQPMRALVSVTAYSYGAPTVYTADDITAAPAAYGYTYEEGPGLLSLRPMPYGSTVRVVYTPGLSDKKRQTAQLAALELVRFWWQPSQGGVLTENPLARSGGGTGTVLVAGYLVPNAVASLLDAISESGPGFA